MKKNESKEAWDFVEKNKAEIKYVDVEVVFPFPSKEKPKMIKQWACSIACKPEEQWFGLDDTPLDAVKQAMRQGEPREKTITATITDPQILDGIYKEMKNEINKTNEIHDSIHNE